MMRRAPIVLLGLALGAPRVAAAQWGVSAEIGVARFSGSSRDSSGTVVGPYRPTTFALRVDRAFGAVALAVTVMHAKTGIAGERGGLAVVQYDGASLWEITPHGSLRLARFGTRIEVHLEAGPAFEFWDLDGESRTRLAGRAAASVHWPLAGGFTGSLRVSGVLSKSLFDPADVPAGVERRATRRFGVALGLKYQL
jgi:hypothetical protein